MSAFSRICLFVTATGMELAWLSGIAIFMVFLTGAPFSVLTALPVALFFAVLSERFTADKGFRVITILSVKAVILLFLICFALYLAGVRSDLSPSIAWLEELISGPRDLMEGVVWGTAIIVTLFGWAGGIFSIRHAHHYYRITARFDIGIIVFILLFCATGFVDLPLWILIMLVISFFSFSLPAIALSRYRLAGERGILLQQRREGGTVLFYTGAVLLVGSGIYLLFYPLLTIAAQTGYIFLQGTGRQLVSILGRILQFIDDFGVRLRRGAPVAEESGGGAGAIEHFTLINGESTLFEQLFAWVMIITLLFLLIFTAIWILRHLLRWLLSGAIKTEKSKKAGSALTVRIFLQWCLQVFRQGYHKIRSRLFQLLSPESYKPATGYFRQMLRWGGNSGLPRISSETPCEYGLVLKENFPEIREEIELIVESFHYEVYGEATTDSGRLKQLTRDWRRIRSSKHWPARLRSRITNGGRRLICYMTMAGWLGTVMSIIIRHSDHRV